MVKVGDTFRDKTTRPNEMWQADVTCLKVTGWGWFCLSTVLDDFSRCSVGRKLCTTVARCTLIERRQGRTRSRRRHHKAPDR